MFLNSLGVNRWKDNVRQVEDRLCSVIPRDRWNKDPSSTHFLWKIPLFSRKPKCDICPLLEEDCEKGQKRYKASLKEA